VASVPQSHVYVWHLSREHGEVVHRLPDPIPDEQLRSGQQGWWPPVMLDPTWARDNEFDIFHIHFGFDASEPAQLRELVDVLRRRGKPLVYTVHDLRNPHHTDTALHDAHLDILIPAADEVITLTAGAAAEIRRRWGREPLVLPHPHVVDLETMTRLRERAPRDTFRVGLHVKSLRASMDPLRILPALAEAVRALPDAVLQVNAHDELMEPDGRCYRKDFADDLRELAAREEIDLRVHPFFSDAQLWEYLHSLDVSVLPYQFGTHSGWLEGCRDLGTTVVAPSCGYYADQAPVLGYELDETSFSEESLAVAIKDAYENRGLGAVTVADRREQREQVADEHERLYRRLLG
jgi:glycosyltransferase involved in cell wall biosynthesis